MKIKDIKNRLQIKILGKPYKITWYDDDSPADDGRIGYTDTRVGRMYIHGTMTGEQSFETIIHEVVHVLNLGLDIDLNESDINRISTGITAFLLDNEFVG